MKMAILVGVLSGLSCLVAGAGDLSMAIRKEDHKTVDAALSAEANVNELDASGYSPLFHAVVARDVGVVEMLLKAGANVALEGQSREPLWAAVVNGDKEIVAALLAKGSDPEAGVPGWRPVEAAIMSGRVDVLKQLLAAKETVKLPKKYVFIRQGADANHQALQMSSDSVSTLRDAVLARHSKMATFLLEQGVFDGEKKELNLSLMAASAHRPGTDFDLIEALLAAGADPWEYLASWEYRVQTAPNCSAGAAARSGKADLLGRYLKLAPGNDAWIRHRLYYLSVMSGDKETIELVKSFFPDVELAQPIRSHVSDGALAGPENEPRTVDDTKRVGRMVLQPRHGRKVSASEASDGLSVAVIAEDKCSNEGDFLAVELSTIDGWTVLERTEVEAQLGEQQLAIGNASNVEEMVSRLSADYLIMLTKPGKDAFLRAELINVATGLSVKRMHSSTDEADLEKWVERLKSELVEAHDSFCAAGGRIQAVTLLGVGALSGVEQSDTARSLVAAGLMLEIDSLPGCVAMTRMQMQPLVEEQVVGAEEGIWGAAWSLEAGVGWLGEGDLELNLRLLNLRTGESHDSSGKGDLDAIADLVGRVWADLVGKSGVGKPSGDGASSRDAESRMLLKEAQWRFSLKEYEASARMADAAYYLGLDSPEVHSMRIKSRLNALPRERWVKPDSFEQRMKGSVLDSLPDAVEVVDLMIEEFDSVTSRLIGDKPPSEQDRPCYWLNRLLEYRSSVSFVGRTREDVEVLRRFDRSLEEWTRSYLRWVSGNWDKLSDQLQLPHALETLDSYEMRDMGWLGNAAMDFMTRVLNEEHASVSRNIGEVLRTQIESWSLLRSSSGMSRYNSPGFVHDPDYGSKLLGGLDQMDPVKRNQLEKELSMILASNEERASRADAVADGKVEALKSGGQTIDLVPLGVLSRYRVVDLKPERLIPDKGEFYCVNPFTEKKGNGELLHQLSGYRAWKKVLKGEGGPFKKLRPYIDFLVRVEKTPGETRMRERIAELSVVFGLSDELKEKLTDGLPPDLGTEDGLDAAIVEPFAWVEEMPIGADAFDVGSVAWERGSRYLWMSGCFCKGVVKMSGSSEEAIPGLVRVDLDTSEVEVRVSPGGWGDWKKRSNMMINSDCSEVHVGGGRTVWHVQKHGVWEVNQESCDMLLLAEKVGLSRVHGKWSAGAIVGDYFYALEGSWTEEGPGGKVRSKTSRVLRLKAGEKPFPIVQVGRRPERTPLDANGNTICCIAPNKGRLRVFSNTDYAKRGNGVSMIGFPEDGAVEGKYYTKRSAEVLHYRSLAEKAPMEDKFDRWELSDGFLLGQGSKASSLTVVRKGKQTHERFEFKVPECRTEKYHYTFQEDLSTNEMKTFDSMIGEMIKKGAFHPQVVAEDESSVFIMMRREKYAPVVWRVEKKALLKVGR